VAFHADAQRAAFALGKLAQPLFGQIQLRQHPVRHRQQILAGLRQAQTPSFAQPDIGAELHLQLLHAVAQSRLGQVQHARRSRQGTLFFDLLDDAQMDTFKHLYDLDSWICEIKPFYVMDIDI